MSSERIKAAAELLRVTAEGAVCPCGGPVCTTANWFRLGELESRLDGSEYAAPFVEMMSPNVALALADWLDDEASIALFGGLSAVNEYALAVVDAILRAEPHGTPAVVEGRVG